MTVDRNWKHAFLHNSIEFQTAFGKLSSAELNWRPSESAWSIAQNIDHLIRLNESYYPVLEQVAAGTHQVPWTGKIGFIPRYLGNFILTGVEPQRKRKTSTFPVWEPSASTLSPDIIDRFCQHHLELIQRIESVENLFGQKKIISSPANRMVVYPLDRLIPILIAHEKRHYNQAKEVLAFQVGIQF